MPRKLKIGIVGCGAIGSRIAKAVTKDFGARARLVALCDTDKNKAEKLKNKLKDNKIVVCSLDKLIRLSGLVVESASVGISAQVAEKVISQGKDILVMSVGGLLERQDILQKARKRNASVYLPSGGICGLDGLKAAAISKIKKITLTTRKPVKSLPNYFSKIKRETLIFKGNASDAVRKFPQNINVAATLSLAGLGAKMTFVRIIASPGINRNIHEVEIESDSGRIFTRTENVQSPDNPKTSYLASLSAIATLKQIFDAVKIGT